MELLKQEGAIDIPVVVGGTIPLPDVETLKQMGVKEVFLPGTSLKYIVDTVKRLYEERVTIEGHN
jgi:methylmalonyl-CoA mutase C-terminal domain/subunit